MIGADLAVPVGAVLAALVFSVGHLFGRVGESWKVAKARADLEAMRTAADGLVWKLQKERGDLRARLAAAQADANEWQSDHAELYAKTKALRAQLAQAEAEAEALKVQLAEECRVTNLWIAEWDKLECQRKGLKYSSTYFNQPETPEIITREAEGAKLAEARAQLIAQLAEGRSAPSAVHGPEAGQCEDDEQKKVDLQDGSADV